MIVVGAGFAGVEAAWAIANRGGKVTLFEMRPAQMTPAHTTGFFAELVCSNSLKSLAPDSPAGQLKAEMTGLGSIVLQVAKEHSVPGGQALAVDREKFGVAITERVRSHPNIEVVGREFGVNDLAAGEPIILSTGPLTTSPLADWLADASGRAHLYFYDAVSPTIEASSIDMSVAFLQSRWDKGGDDYINCPLDRERYEAFVRELVAAERAPIHAFEAGGNRDAPELEKEGAFLEKIKYFSGCMPIEAIAEKGERSLSFGNFKPIGLTDPRTGRRPHAAIQLRPENAEGTLYSMVACQTRLKWGEQKRVFRMVPGLEQAEFVRYGVIHRNTYVDAPRILDSSLRFLPRPSIYLAGQLTGVEGYVESAAMGILAGISATMENTYVPPPRASALGSLMAHLGDQTEREFAPMNINWGLFPAGEVQGRKIDKGVVRAAKIEAARCAFDAWKQIILR